MGKNTHNKHSGVAEPLISGLELYNIMMWEIEPCLTSDQLENTKAELEKMPEAARLEELAHLTQALNICAEAMEELNMDLKFETEQWQKVLDDKLAEIYGAEDAEAMKRIDELFEADTPNI